MKLRLSLFVALILLAVSLMLIVAEKNSLPVEIENDHPVATQLPSATPTPKTSWLILPDLPSSATQADVGAEIYRLVCRDCHGVTFRIIWRKFFRII